MGRNLLSLLQNLIMLPPIFPFSGNTRLWSAINVIRLRLRKGKNFKNLQDFSLLIVPVAIPMFIKTNMDKTASSVIPRILFMKLKTNKISTIAKPVLIWKVNIAM
jgi:hypothetical protein